MTSASAEYKLLDTNDTLHVDGEPLYPTATGDRTAYPGCRRVVLEGGPPPGSALIKTGGNALQAIDERFVEQKNLISVAVPHGTNPGDVILVQCPHDDRLVSTVIPEGAQTGHAFLVEVPPMQPTPGGTAHGDVDTNGYDVIKVAAEIELEKRHFGDEETGSPYHAESGGGGAQR
jgi:hypothetical protein